jgi:hypothetical protein
MALFDSTITVIPKNKALSKKTLHSCNENNDNKTCLQRVSRTVEHPSKNIKDLYKKKVRQRQIGIRLMRQTEKN